ncbi:hypothetical protein E9549_14215 [Blastococcus sp. MG754426]|uniref:hypothetical protein n=1 Tax=unclassified Blastococcus TaxID=2619396 RepID=UPI001EEF81D5|nr:MULTISPECIES: hypothetical protein [unclassified Blastococcus]MCF6508551.1 hypothetical protein [Blastococcus sp. MG754426]MCF6510742.1 hypothetical protein [Blastococcus sp. MG754427]MCF6734306.1 hypothetical protein [Blastococcus sp. KM273129]
MLETAPDGTSHPNVDRAGGTHRPEAERSGLAEYLAALRRYWWLALTTFLLVLAVAVGSLFVLGPVYRADAEVLIRTEDSRQLFPRTGGTSAGALIRSPAAELVYVGSDEFQRLAAEAAGDEAEVEVRGTADSSALVFVAEAGSAEAAQDAAQTWAETYVAVRHASDVAETAALRDLLIGDRDALQARQQEILQPVAALDEAVAVETDPVELSRLLNQRLAIQRTLSSELDPVETELRRLNTQIASLDVDLRVMENPQALAYVSSAAELPDERADGSLRRNVLVGVVAGLVLAGGAVAAAQALRRR